MLNSEALYAQSIKDFFTKPFLLMSLLPFIVASGALFSILFFFAGEASEWFSILSAPPEQNTQVNISFTWDSIWHFIFGLAFVKWLFMMLVYLVGSFAAVLLSVVIAVIVIGFFTPYIVKIVHQRHYSHIELNGHGNIFSTTIFTIKTLLIALLMLIGLFPFFFIPVVGAVVINLPVYYLFHKLLSVDVSESINSKEEYKRIMSVAGNHIRFNTFLLFLVSLIPLAGVLLPVYFVIVLTHLFFRETIELREATEAI